MRRLELTWETGQWSSEIAQMIVDEILNALDSPQLNTTPWQRPDSVRMIREGDPVYPDGEMRDREGIKIGAALGTTEPTDAD
jgi:hypothetical protein